MIADLSAFPIQGHKQVFEMLISRCRVISDYTFTLFQLSGLAAAGSKGDNKGVLAKILNCHDRILGASTLRSNVTAKI